LAAFAGRSPARGAVAAAACALAVLFAGVTALRSPGTEAAPAPRCGTTDVARGADVRASSTDAAATPPSAVVDGDPATRWSSAWTDPQWLTLDLHRRVSICRVALDWERASATAFDVEVSDDGQAWRQVYATTTGAGGSETLDVAAAGRYLRLELRARATPYGYSLFRVAVFEGTAASPGTSAAGPAGNDALLSYRKPVEASSARDDKDCSRCSPAKAVDGLTGSRWATAARAEGAGWLTVDLGAPAEVHRVVLQWAAAYATVYDLQVSPDGSAWATVHHTDAGPGRHEDLAVSARGRYLRLYAARPANGDGFSLWELSVYGSGGAPIAPPTVSAPADPMRLVWSDEFDGAAGSPPDPGKWHPDTGPGVTGELQYYTDNRNAALDGTGHLNLEARREVVPGSTCPPDPRSQSVTCQYTSARLNTHGSFDFQYGRAEARIKVSGTPGLWPAFWMLGADLYTGQAGWPECGEIDVMEHVGRQPDRSSSTLHGPGYQGADGIGAPYRAPVADLAADFHVYAVDWRPDRISFAVDGHEFFTVRKDDTERTRGPWVYDHPFVLLLNNAVGGPMPGPPTADTVFPQQMLVDYVRVYR
jgi:beta-glucanase (GH16 family)